MPVTHGHELSTQDFDLLGYSCGPPTPGTSPHPRQGGHCPCLPAPYSLSAHCCQRAPNLRSRLRPPAPLPRSDCVSYIHGAPWHFAGEQQSKYPTTPPSFLRGEEGGAKVDQVYPRPQDSAPKGMAPTGCHYGTPAPIATKPVSIPRFPSPRPNHRKPRSKDLCCDGKLSWKAFLHKFVRLARSEQWTEVEQQDQFCFALEGLASEYSTRC